MGSDALFIVTSTEPSCLQQRAMVLDLRQGQENRSELEISTGKKYRTFVLSIDLIQNLQLRYALKSKKDKVLIFPILDYDARFRDKIFTGKKDKAFVVSISGDDGRLEIGSMGLLRVTSSDRCLRLHASP